jgi:putative endonuclease
MKRFWVYILASKPNGVLYIGVTSDLIKRVYQHREKSVEGFTKEYHVSTLVYFEEYADAESAITREKRLKKWYRSMKVDLIERHNPLWEDMYPAAVGGMVAIPAYAGMTGGQGDA